MPRRKSILVAVAVVGVMGTPGLAQAAPQWLSPQTVELTRGTPEPEVATAADGRAAVVYSLADRSDESRLALLLRRPGEPFVTAAMEPTGATSPAIAMSPSGVVAVVAVDAGRLMLTRYQPIVNWGATGEVIPIPGAGTSAGQPQIGIDNAGRVTIVWISPPLASPSGGPQTSQIQAVTVDPAAGVGPIETLGAPGDCSPELDVNLRGDAVVAGNCFNQGADMFYRPAGGSFGPGEAPFAADGSVEAAIDGAGTVHAIETSTVPSGPRGIDFEFRLAYAVRPPNGPWGASRPLDNATAGPADIEAQEDGRVIAGWRDGDRLRYAIGATGSQLGTARTAARARATARYIPWTPAFDIVAARRGPVLLAWRESYFSHQRVAAAWVEADGSLTKPYRGIPGDISPSRPAFAVSDSGIAVGAWEQRCSVPEGGFALMAVAFDNAGRPDGAPCQDRVAPQVLIRPQRARLVGQTLRFRAGCNEDCRLVVRVRVLRRGLGKPLATKKTPRPQALQANRFRSFKLRLRRAEATRVRAALAARRRVTVRFALSVSDSYENGAVRRVAVPLRR